MIYGGAAELCIQNAITFPCGFFLSLPLFFVILEHFDLSSLYFPEAKATYSWTRQFGNT